MRRDRILLVALLCAAAVWVAESMLDAMVFRVSAFPEAFFPLASPQDLYFRWITVLVIVGAGVLLSAAAEHAGRERRGRLAADSQRQESERRLEEASRELNAGREQDRALRVQLETCRDSLERVREQLRVVMEGASDWEIWLDDTGLVRWTSPAVERVTGYTPEACRAMPDYPLALISPEDRPLVRAALEREGGGEEDMEIRFLRRDGAVGWGRFRCRPVTDSAGRPAGRRIGILDITREHAAREDLARERVRLERLLSAAPLAILELDSQGVVRAARGAGLLGLRADPALEGQPLFEQAADGRPALEAAWQRLRAGQAVAPVPVRWRVADGAPIPVAVALASLPGGAGAVAAITADDARRTAEDLLRFSRFCVDRAADAIVWADEAGRLQYGNETACRLLECSPETLTSRDITALDSRLTQGQWPAAWQALRQAGTVTLETEHRRADGRPIPIRITWHHLRHGAREYACAMIRDVTQSRHAEALLQESEERFRLLTENSTFGMLVFQGDRVVYSNRAAEALTGFGAADLAAMDFWARIHPEHRDRVRDHVRTLPGRAGSSDRFELLLERQDGRERWVDARFSPLQWNRIPSVLTTFQDVTDRKAAEKALQESETRYRRLVESVTDYIYTVKVQDGRVVETRHGPGCVAVTGYTSAEYDANPYLWVTMVPEADRPAVLAQAEKILKGGDAQPLEHRLIHKDGRTIWVKNAPVPHHDERGRLTGYDGMVSNITARRLAEEGIIEHARTLELLNRVILAANHAVDLRALLQEALDAALGLLRFDFGGVYMLDADGREAELVLALHPPPGLETARRRVRVAESPYRRVFELGEAIFAENYAALAPEAAAAWSMVSLCSIPLVSKNRIIGALNLAGRRPHAFTEAERETLLAIGRQVGTAVEKLRSEEALRASESKYRTITEHSLTGIFILAEGRLAFANEGFAKILGFPLRQILAWDLAQFMDHIHPDDKAFVADQNRRKLEAETEGDVQPVFDCRLITSQGSIKWVLLHSRRIEFPGGKALAGVAVDITDRKLAEQAVAAANRQLRAREEQLRAVNEQLFGVIEQLKASERDLVGANAEKEILMKEIHHRVKNNLQVISSLLNLQTGHVSDPDAVALLKDCQGRIKSMALVHEQLCQARNLAEIDIGEYIRALANHLFVMYGTASAGIRLTLGTARVHLGLDRAIPCSLIINELVSNSLKYGFPGGREGEIRVDLDAVPGSDRFRLVVADNGVGFPADVDFRNSSTLGLQLVMTFVEQLGGRIELDRQAGTRFTIEFPGASISQPSPVATGQDRV